MSFEELKGLDQAQVEERKAQGLVNKPSDAPFRSEKQIVLSHLCTFFNLVFAVLALILVFAGSGIKNMAFLGVVVTNLAIGIIQEIRAKRAVEKLTLVAGQTLKTLRSGAYAEVRSEELVRDDVVFFVGGNQIPADARVLAGQLQVNESLLTGEPDAIIKNPGDELFSGSFVVAGRGAAVLTRVGDESYAAKLSAEAKKNPKAGRSQLMQDLDRLIRVLSAILIPMGVLYFLNEYLGPDPDTRTAAERTVAALVSMIPQGLYLLTSIAMAASAIALSRQRVLVRDMNCIETLARVDVLCLDKTGTITEPHMEAEGFLSLNRVPDSYVEEAIRALYGTEEPENDTARALQAYFGTETDWICRRRIPFTSEKKWGGAVFEEQGSFLVGAPEMILGPRYEELRPKAQPLLEHGFRVLLVARYMDDLTDRPEPDLVMPLALIKLRNPIRDEAPETFRYFRDQGVQIKVLSGDNALAAARVAARAGISGAERYVDATTLETEEDFLRASEAYNVFGRVTPEKKRALIRAMKKRDHVVAMTGDGVNDVLAMREADCSFAMAGGAQAASQVASMVLLDGDFSVMPGILGEGRRVINNIRRTAALFLVKNIFTLLLVLTSLLSSVIYPFQPVTLTLISSLTVGAPGFFLALEPNYERVKGSFLSDAVLKALPAGLASFLTIVAVQLLWGYLGVDSAQLSAVCGAVLGIVGVLVLWQVSRPLTPLRIAVMGTMTAALCGAFALLGDLFAVQISDGTTLLWTVAFMAGATALYFGLSWLTGALSRRLKKA